MQIPQKQHLSKSKKKSFKINDSEGLIKTDPKKHKLLTQNNRCP
jgi:hypothetical protein